MKKPEHIDDTKFVDRWRIDLPQLDRLLAMSDTACYWLIGAAGEVFVIPARFIDGTRKKNPGEVDDPVVCIDPIDGDPACTVRRGFAHRRLDRSVRT